MERFSFFVFSISFLYALSALGFVAFAGLVFTILAAFLSPTLALAVLLFFSVVTLWGSTVIASFLTGILLVPVGLILLFIVSLVRNKIRKYQDTKSFERLIDRNNELLSNKKVV